jgi:hypothetical protein
VIDPRSLQHRQPPVEPVSLEDLRLLRLLDLACEIERQLAVHLLGLIYAGSADADDEEARS